MGNLFAVRPLHNEDLGTEEEGLLYTEVSTIFRACVVWLMIYWGSHKQSVIERFLLLGEFVIRGSTIDHAYIVVYLQY